MLQATRPPDANYLVRGDWSERTLGSYLFQAADASPDQLALVEAHTRLTYRELAGAVSDVSAGLGRSGVVAGDVVSVMLPNWWEAMVAMQAVLATGAVVNPVVPIYRDHEVRFILRQSAPGAVIIPHQFRGFDYVEMMERLVAELAEPPVVIVIRPQGLLPCGFVSWDELSAPGWAPTARPPGRGANGATTTGQALVASDIALLLYTSGTTADPKGVLHSHQTLEYEDRSIISLLGLTPADTIFMPSPVTHITGFLYGIVMPAMLGVACVMLDVWDPARARQLIETEQCRFTLAATPFLLGLVEQYESDQARSALRVFPCGGADVPPDLVRRARKVMGTDVVRVYGSSEFPTFSCGGPGDEEAVAAQSDGKPIGPVRYRLDEPADGVGELLVSGPELFLGYLDPALNADAFTPDGYFRTGDLASVGADQAVTIRGRVKDVINRGGEKISAREVEDLIFEHPAVREVAVVGMPDPVLVERVSAYVVLEPGSTLTLAEISNHLQARRIARQKIPEQVTVVDHLPKTASGKVQKFLLRTRAGAVDGT
ncbi:MAG TPA: AMP-binding protein [Trebonia sp.]